MTVTIHWRPFAEIPMPMLGARIFFALGCVAAGYCAAQWIDTSLYRYRSIEQLNAARAIGRNARGIRPSMRAEAMTGSAASWLDIPRLGLSVPVAEGTGSQILRRAAGHIEGTAFPDEAGNVGIAAHRDTLFRKLSGIRPGDAILLTTTSGQYKYSVEWMKVVAPRDVQVLAGAHDPELTLVTCYPFGYLGSAPERFIVRARLVDREP
ncbi:MAG: class D sortase [Acidobacteriota bacterium]|nr:class D sortase [Acidobacteriota bacterium]